MKNEHYYNEPDPFCIGWLRELMKDGLIPHGQIDTRPIQEVAAADVRGFTQCHFFAGIGGWPLALRIAGWPETTPVWTGSCPCPPFSVAGKRKECPRCQGEDFVPCPSRTGFFLCCVCGEAWFADERHLWPEWWRILRGARPGCPVFGEQVASEAGRAWLAVVRATLAILDHGAWGADLCSAGVGKDHIRQRLYWMANPAHGDGRRGKRAAQEGTGPHQVRGRRFASRSVVAGGVAHTASRRRSGNRRISGTQKERITECSPSIFISCADGKYRPVPANARTGKPEPTLFPLVDYGTVRNRVGILRGAGNAIDPFLAAEWITACADVMGWELRLC